MTTSPQSDILFGDIAANMSANPAMIEAIDAIEQTLTMVFFFIFPLDSFSGARRRGPFGGTGFGVPAKGMRLKDTR